MSIKKGIITIQVENLLQYWNGGLTFLHNDNFNPTPILHSLSNLFEKANKHNHEINLDVYNYSNPYEIDPSTKLGFMYSSLLNDDKLMNVLFNDYFKDDLWPTRPIDNHNLNIAACRLLTNILLCFDPGPIVERFVNNQFIQNLFSWTENPCVSLQIYAVGLLASCMIPLKASVFKIDNQRLIPIILHSLHDYILFREDNEDDQNAKNFSLINSNQTNIGNTSDNFSSRKKMSYKSLNIDDTNPIDGIEGSSQNGSDNFSNKPILDNACTICDHSSSSLVVTETSLRNWIEIYPLNLTTKLIFFFKYLTNIAKCIGDYDQTIEKYADIINLVMKIINPSKVQNVYVTYEALKYLAILFYNPDIGEQFIATQGIQKLLLIPKHSIVSTSILVCFWTLSLFQTTLEKILGLPEQIFVDLLKYELWMLKNSHGLNKCYVLKFLNNSFHCNYTLEIFDDLNGLYKLINAFRSLPILTSLDDCENVEDNVENSEHIMYHGLVSLKQYFKYHLHNEAQRIQLSKVKDTGFIHSAIHNVPSIPDSVKLLFLPEIGFYKEIELLSNAISINNRWPLVDKFIELDGLKLLLKIINLVFMNYFNTNRQKIITCALEVINICAVLPKVQLLLCKKLLFKIQENSVYAMNGNVSMNENVAMNIFMNIASGKFVGILDGKVQKASLSIIKTCACAPIHQEEGSKAFYLIYEVSKTQTHTTDNVVVIEKIWDFMKEKNGISMLLELMNTVNPYKDADDIRVLACQTLIGLARCESVRQIISKLPLFNSDQLQNGIKSPAIKKEGEEHESFEKYVSELMQLVFGTTNNGAEIKTSLMSINRAKILVQTKIHFDDEQLLMLVHQNLKARGLSKSAEALLQEANIKPLTSLPTHALRLQNQSVGEEMSPTISSHAVQNQISKITSSSNGFLSYGPNMQRINSTPKHLIIKSRSKMHPIPEPQPIATLSKLDHKKLDQDKVLQSDVGVYSTVDLKSIVTEYFTSQHALCKNPMVTCPTFNFVPHKCPDPRPKNINFAVRYSKNIYSRRQDRKLIFSRFCPTLKFSFNGKAQYLCCEFLKRNHIAIGTYSGKIKVFNTYTKKQLHKFKMHNSDVTNLECSNDEKLLISSTSHSVPLICILGISDTSITLKYSLYEKFCTFSNYDQTKLIGSKNKVATIYDVETCQKIMTLVPKNSNEYYINRAVFDPQNQLVLSDGVLWDINAGKEVHKFDKLNPYVNGLFHPNGLEIISNTEVWDMRTFQLLRSIPSLDQCNVLFSKTGNGMYSYVINQVSNKEPNFLSSFQTYDPYDYSNLSTIHVEEPIYHMACDKYDTRIAVVENQLNSDSGPDSFVQIYDIGRSKIDEK